MKRNSLKSKPQRRWSLRSVLGALLFVITLLGCQKQILQAQTAIKAGQETPKQESLVEQIQKLNDAMTRTQAQLEQSQRDMEEMRRQLAALQQKIANAGPPTEASSSTPPAQAAAAIDDLRERQAIEETQIATQEQTKVESASKYPVKLRAFCCSMAS